jgi:hypothetical protein
MRRRSMQWFAAVCCAASLASAAIAAEDYPCKPEGDRDSAFCDIEHMDPNYLIKLHLGGFSFAIPYAYESWRSTPERVNCSPVRDRFEFAFWMPDLRPSVKDASHRASWPKEEKRPPGGGYIVEAEIREIPEDQETPGYGFPYIREDFEESAERKPAFDGHLIAISKGPIGWETYVNFEGEEFHLNCTPTENCMFTVYFSDLKLAVQGGLVYDKLAEWRAVKEASRTLIQRWIVKQP